MIRETGLWKLVLIQVNPLPDENDDPEINIIKDSMNDDDDNYVDLDENGKGMIYLTSDNFEDCFLLKQF